MEIQKVFSNIEDPEETLYSVLMTEDEVALYSEFQKEFNSKAQKGIRKRFDIGQSPVPDDYIKARYEEVNDILKKPILNARKEDIERGQKRMGRETTSMLHIDPLEMRQKGVDGYGVKDNYKNVNRLRRHKEKIAAKQKASAESIAKHAKKADKLRKLKYKRQTSGKVALGTAAAVGLAYGGKKLYEKKKNKDNR